MQPVTNKALSSGFFALLFSLMLAALALLWGAAFTWMHESGDEALRGNARAVALSVRTTVEDALAFGVPLPTMRGADSYFARMLEDNPTIRFIAVLDAQGKPLFVRGVDASAIARPAAPPEPSAEAASQSEAGDPVSSLPIHTGDEVVGTVMVAARPLDVAAEMTAHGLPLALALATCLMLAAAGGRLVLRRLCFAPLAVIADQLRVGASGQFDGIDPPRRRDEIGKIGRALALTARLVRERANHFHEYAEEVQLVVADPATAAAIDTLRTAAEASLGGALLRHAPPDDGAERDQTAGSQQSASLRIRVTLLVFSAIMLVTVGMAFATRYRESLSSHTASADAVASIDANWRKLSDRAIAGLADAASQLATDPQVAEAIDQHDSAALGAALQANRKRNGGGDPDTDIDVATPDGGLLYGGSGLDGSTLVGSFAITTMERTGEPILGLAITPARETLAVFARPVKQGDRVVGTVTLSHDIVSLFRDLSGIVGAEVFLLDLEGKLVQGGNAALWQKIAGKVDLGRRGMRFVEAGDAVFATTAMSLPTISAGRLGYLLTVRDVTDQQSRSRRLQMAFYGMTFIFMCAAVGFVYYYLCHAFAPLDTAITALHTLSRGKTSVMLDLPATDDEVGRIAAAVWVFRDRTRALVRVSEERGRRRRRQERMIRRQMLKLAETLQDGAREAVLKDLDNIERAASSRTPGAEVAAELDALAIAFQTMAGRVREQHRELDSLVAELREALKANTAFIALQQELEIARELQLSILPKLAADQAEYEAHAFMIPAKEVGGDFYDFFALSPRQVGMVVADVSGKGVPAALFMAVSRTLLKATARFKMSPGQCLEKLNGLLEEGNEKQLFVTVFYAILDLDTGALTYANGGHNPPVMIGRDGQVMPLEGTDGIALAIEPGLSYNERTIMMRQGDTIVMYTDGVTEAKNPQTVEFGEDRLIELLRQCAGLPAREIIARVLEAVNEFAAQGPQTDDITCFAFRYNGADTQGDTKIFVLRNDLGELPGLRNDIEAFLESFAIPTETAFNICLSLDEIFTNIVSYGYDDPAEHRIEIVIRHDGAAVTATITDDGKEYDPLGNPEPPDLDADLDDRTIGGLGIFLVRTFMDDVHYSRDGACNRLVIVKHVGPPTPFPMPAIADPRPAVAAPVAPPSAPDAPPAAAAPRLPSSTLKYNFISGLPRAGSGLLSAILQQNPRFHAGLPSPVESLVAAIQRQLSAGSPWSPAVATPKRRTLIRGLFDSYYADVGDATQTVFDANPAWCARLPMVMDLFPDARIICCVRNVAWIMDSLERLYRADPFAATPLFADEAERATVYSRLETLAQRDRLVGYACAALREAVYGEHAHALMLVDFDRLTRDPGQILAQIYRFIGEEPFAHDFDNVTLALPPFDPAPNTLPVIRRHVGYEPRPTVLPPDLFDKYAGLSFWTAET